jgi:hypothetical protein
MVVVVAIVATGLLGTAFMSMATSTRLGRVNLATSNRAYYLAESGAAYVRAMREIDRNAMPFGTYTLNNGDQFQVSTATNNEGRVIVQAVGIANPGTSLEARHAVTINYRNRVDKQILDLGFDNDYDGALDQEWNFTAEGDESDGIPAITTAPEGGEALEMANWSGNFQLNWNTNPDLDLVKAWSNNNKRMSYDVQAKVSAAKNDGYPDNPLFNSILLVGIGFRLQPDRLSGYGVSFYRNNPNYRRNAPWTNDLSNTFLTTLRNTNVYLTLWSRVYPGKRQIIAYKRLRPTDLLQRSSMNSGEYDLKAFSTILVNLKEEFVGVTSNRVNKISVFIQSTNIYPRWPDGIQNYVHAKWQDNTNIFPRPVAWDSPSGRTVITNSLFTSANFHVLKPPEINLHVYDYATKFFDDFVMRVEGFENPALPGSSIQY